METIHSRLIVANKALEVISSHGRRFFYNGTFDRISTFELIPSKLLDEPSLAIRDDYRGTLIPVSASDWREFGWSHGGTLKELVLEFSQFVLTGKKVRSGWIGMRRYDGSYIWGYSADEVKATLEGLIPLDILEVELQQ